MLFRYALGWAWVYLGLAVRNEQTLDSLGPLVFPITMIGNTFVPLSVPRYRAAEV